MESASGRRCLLRGGYGDGATGWLAGISGGGCHDIVHLTPSNNKRLDVGYGLLNRGSLAFADVCPGNQFQWSQAFSADVDAGADENRAPREVLGVDCGEVDETVFLNQPGEDKHTLYELWS